MVLGEKLRQARLEAGLSQRQLAGDTITRNMLSQIEHGSATPSMKTLQYLCAKLGKPISYFLEEAAVASPNLSIMESARRLYDSGSFSEAALVLEGYQAPDPLFDREKNLLRILIHLELAARAIAEGRPLYAQSLLENAKTEGICYAGFLERQRLLLLGRIQGQHVASRLPSLDEELLLRAGEALEANDALRAAQLLDAAQEHSPRWYFLRGQTHLARKEYREAAACLHQAEASIPQVSGLLETCYRELGDYKRAYEYACKQRKK